MCCYCVAGASVTQHPEFSELLEWLMRPERDHVRMSIASVRTNTVTPQLAAALSARYYWMPAVLQMRCLFSHHTTTSTACCGSCCMFQSVSLPLKQPTRHLRHVHTLLSNQHHGVRLPTCTPQLRLTLIHLSFAGSRGTRSLTVAVESGSERMRRIVNKKLESADILQCAENAQVGVHRLACGGAALRRRFAG